MADRKISEVPADDVIGGNEKIPLDDAGVAKHTTTGVVKNYVIDQIEAIAAASGVTLSRDSVYLLVNGELKPLSAQALASAVLDYGFELAGEISPYPLSGDELFAVKDDGVKVTITLDDLKVWFQKNIALPWDKMSMISIPALLDGSDELVIHRANTQDSSEDIRVPIYTYKDYVCAAFKAYVEGLTAIDTVGGESVDNTDCVYIIHGGVARKASVSQLFATAGITNAVIGPDDPQTGNATTENCIPQWDSTVRKLKNGLTLASKISDSPSATKIPTEAAVANYLDGTGIVKTVGDQSVAGTKTFTNPPIVPTPTASTHAANKDYVDNKVLDNVVKTVGDQTISGEKEFLGSVTVQTPVADTNPATKKYVDGNCVKLTGDQFVDGVKTFSSSPIAPTPETTDSSTKVSTTAWVSSKLTEWWASVCSAVQTISGVWTFNDSPKVPTVGDTTDSSLNAASTAFVHNAVDAIDLRFKFVNKTFGADGTLTLDDRSLNAITLPVIPAGDTTTSYTVSPPADSETHSRCFGIVLATSTADSGSLKLKLATNSTYYAESADTFAITPGSYNIIMFQEMKATNEFIVWRRTLSATGTEFSGSIS